MTNSLNDYILSDVLSSIEGITTRTMFGALAMYKSGVIFGMIIDEKLYLKVDDKNLAEFKKIGGKPFVYQGKKKTVEMPYFEVPEEIYEDHDLITKLAESAIAAGLRRKKK